MKQFSIVLFGLVTMLSSQVLWAGDAAAGKKSAALCASCHGTNGVATMPAYPNLAGQNEPYLVSALRSYRDKQRSGGMSAIMQMQAAKLSDEDIDNIAAYFAGL